MANQVIDPEPEDDFMKASAEEWSKDPAPEPMPHMPSTPTDRWGAPEKPADIDDGNRWGAEKLDNSDSPQLKDLFPKKPQGEKKKFPWWLIIVGILVVIGLCIGLIVLLGVLIF